MIGRVLLGLPGRLRGLSGWLVRDPFPPSDPKPDLAAAVRIVENSKDGEAILFVDPEVLVPNGVRGRLVGIAAGTAAGTAFALIWNAAGADPVGSGLFVLGSAYLSAALSDPRYRPSSRIVGIVSSIAVFVVLVCVALETAVESGPTVFASVCAVWGTMHRFDRGIASRQADRRSLPVILFADRLTCLRTVRGGRPDIDDFDGLHAWDRRLHPTTRVHRMVEAGRPTMVLEDDAGRLVLPELVAVDEDGNRLGNDPVEEIVRRIAVL